MSLLDVTIPGQPQGKGRPKFVRATGRAYTPKGTAEWERGAALIIRNAWMRAPLDALCSVTITAVFARPKRLLRKKDPHDRIPCDVKPDIDNVIKCALDALVMAGALRDDKTVWRVNAEKYFAARDEGPAVIIRLEE